MVRDESDDDDDNDDKSDDLMLMIVMVVMMMLMMRIMMAVVVMMMMASALLAKMLVNCRCWSRRMGEKIHDMTHIVSNFQAKHGFPPLPAKMVMFAFGLAAAIDEDA